jgi:hypothetical protein
MVTIPRELKIDHLKFHITLESGKKTERNPMEPRGDEGTVLMFHVH